MFVQIAGVSMSIKEAAEVGLMVLGFTGSALSCIVSLYTRAAVAELARDMTTEQEHRCSECRKELVGRREFERALGLVNAATD